MSKKIEKIISTLYGAAPQVRLRGVDLPDSEVWASARSFKGLSEIFTTNVQTESQALQNSIYWDWYHSIRMSKIVWFAHSRKVIPRDKTHAQVCRDFAGAFEFSAFVVWAMKFAASLFAETKNFDLVTRYDPKNPPDEETMDNSLILSIPLNIPRIYLMPQIINFLGKYHPGRAIDVIEQAHTARYNLHTLRFRRNVLEIERLVYVYKTLYPEAQLWLIADRLQLAPNNKVRDDRFLGAKEIAYNRLNSIAGRHLYKIKRRILHVERGNFPNATEIKVNDRVQPFGRAMHPEYLRATHDGIDEKSEWQQWLHNEYHGLLVREVLKRNHFDRETVDMSSVPDFLSGRKNFVKRVESTN